MTTPHSPTDTPDTASAATGEHTTNGVPHGYSSLTPFLPLTDPDGALAFYREVFGARTVTETRMGGVVVHAEIEFAHGRLQLGAATPEYHTRASDPDSEDVSFSLGLYCPDVDATVERALAAGAVLREPVTTFVSGDRFGSIRDPFGVRWSVMTRVEDLSDAESDARVQAWAAEQG